MNDIERQLSARFVCAKCHSKGAEVKSLSMSGTGLSKLLDLQHNRYVFASCSNCGYTEVYNLDILRGSKDSLGNLLDIFFGS